MIKKATMIALLMTIAIAASAMSYSKARTQALFLTDKMGYELNLTDDQYNACYEINLDYIMCLNVQADLFGFYWQRRNSELQFVLTSIQYQRFLATEYFYRPVAWTSSSFHFVIYSHYQKNRFFRNAPTVYDTYRGGNRRYQNSPYQGRTYSNDPNRGAHTGAPQQPGKSRIQAVKGARQQQGSGSTWRQTGTPQQGNFGGRR